MATVTGTALIGASILNALSVNGIYTISVK